MSDEPKDPIVLTHAKTRRDIDQIVYGYQIRGIRVRAVQSPSKKGCDIVLLSGDAMVARASTEHIWDAILEGISRAVDQHGCCFFCGYDLKGQSTPTICPECGRSVDTIAARRAKRDGTLPDPEQTRGY